jgi:carboxypeptidase PM20D1
VETCFSKLAPLMPGVQGFVMRNARLLGKLFFKLAATTPAMESLLKTTVAMTQLSGSPADNVMPSEVRAVINMRLLHPWTVEKATKYIEKIINDKRVTLSPYEPGTDPVPASDEYLKYGWQEIQTAIKEVWQDVVILPFIMVAGTDSRHYQKLAKSIFRFNPQKLDEEELNRIHGHDERISVENLNNELAFYSHLMRLL